MDVQRLMNENKNIAKYYENYSFIPISLSLNNPNEVRIAAPLIV